MERRFFLENGVQKWYTFNNYTHGGNRLNDFLSWLRQLEFGSLLDPALMVAASVLCITVHEASHALAAWRLGDPTAKNAGRLTLNPLRHIDIVGLILLAVVKFGWAKPVPVDMRNFRHPKRDMAITSLAGPVSNVLLAFLALMLYILFYVVYRTVNAAAWVDALARLMSYIALISAGLAVFNLFPVPPLDGSKVLFAVLPERAYGKLMRYERFGMALLCVLLIANVLDTPLLFLRNGLLDLMQDALVPYTRLLLKLFS